MSAEEEWGGEGDGCPMGGRVIHQTKLKHKRGLRAGWRVGNTLPKAKIMNSGKGTGTCWLHRGKRAGEAQLSLSECIKKGEEEGAEQTVASTLLLLNLVHWLPDNRSWPARNPLPPSSLPFLSSPHASPPPCWHARQHDAGVESAWHTIVSTFLLPPTKNSPCTSINMQAGA